MVMTEYFKNTRSNGISTLPFYTITNIEHFLINLSDLINLFFRELRRQTLRLHKNGKGSHQAFWQP